MTAARLIAEMHALGNPEKATHLQRFFKTGEGEYAAGDLFLGIVVPETRRMAKQYKSLPFDELQELIQHPYHEIRLCALLILVEQYKKASEPEKTSLVDFYLKHTAYINNWDLVDLSAPYIIGHYLLDKERSLLYQLVASNSLWERRIAVVSTLTLIRANDFKEALALAELLKTDQQDLMHKATGWVLRETGKKDRKVLTDFLEAHATTLPRTTLRYAIEHYPEEQRLYFLHKRKTTLQ